MFVEKMFGSKRRSKPYSCNSIFPLLVLGLLIFSFGIKFHFHSWRVVWDYHSVQACVERSCLQTAPFSVHISHDEAAMAHGYLHSYLRRGMTPFTPQLLRKESVIPQCSVVGGAPSSRKSAHAKLIDAAPVIRLNIRHPVLMRSEGISTSLGKRTDILILQRNALHHLERYIHGWGQGNQTLSLQRRNAMDALRQSPPILLYRLECPARFRSCQFSLEALVNSTLPSVLPLWLLHPDMEVAARRSLLPFGTSPDNVPSTGIIAIIAALRMCRRVNVFAMSGSTTGDGDFRNQSVWKGHELSAERQLVRWLSNCYRFQGEWCGRLKVFS